MTYRTQGTCSTQIDYEIIEKDGVKCVSNVRYTGGCNGNLKGVGALVEGMPVAEVIERLQGITCGFKKTSCPDQLANALKSEL